MTGTLTMILAPLDAAVRRLREPNSLIAAALFRIAIGFYMLTFYLVHFGQRAALWGPAAVYPYKTFAGALADDPRLALYALNGSAGWAEFLYWAGLIVAGLYVAGVTPRVTGILLFWLSFSVFSRDPWTTDGGTTVMRLMLFYMLFAETGCWFAVGAARRRERFFAATRLAELARITHSFAVGACLVQLALVYLTSIFYKLQGHKWQDGTALYYILRSNTFDLTPFSALVYRHPLIVAAATYGTLMMQLAFPWLMWWRKAKPALFLAIASMHVGIAIAMNLVWFSFIMIAADLLLFPDDMLRNAYRTARAFAQGAHRRLAAALRRPVPVPANFLDDLREPT